MNPHRRGCGLDPGDTPEYPVIIKIGDEVMNKNNKTARLELRVRPGDKEKIARAAKRSGMSIAEYVVHCCLKQVPKAKPPEELWELFNELHEIIRELSAEKQQKLLQLILRLQEVI